MTIPLYHELIHWLISLQELDVCLLQGTRWTEDPTWCTHGHGYSFIQCGDPDGGVTGHAGLLTIVSQKVCLMERFSYATVIPSRLQHVKCKKGEISCDFLNGYQHPLNKTSLREDPLASRHDFWLQLDALIKRLPFRNVALIGGDFKRDTLVNHAASSDSYPDALEFSEILKKHSLTTVRTHDSTPSFQGPNGHATIVFVLM